MIKIKEAIIVEGRYDKARIAAVFDTLIIETDGFGIFTDKKLQAFIVKTARERGIVVLTDTDGAGFKIRSFITSITGGNNIFHALVPDILGKEPRKEKPSKEGKLGIEGIPNGIIVKAVLDSGITQRAEQENYCVFTPADLFELGLTGRENSSFLRRKLLEKLDLPERTSSKMLCKYLSGKYTLDQIKALINSIE